MIKEALQYMFTTGNNQAKVLPVHEDDERKLMLIQHGDGHTVEMDFAKPVEYRHKFRTVAGFVDYLNSHHCKDVTEGIVFVGRSEVFANIGYHSNVKQGAVMLLKYAEEFDGLRVLMGGIGPKDLWRLLVTKMWGTMDPTLAAQVRSIKIDSGSANKVEIDDLGMIKGAGTSATLSITYSDGKSDQKKEIQSEYTYEGRIFECMPNVYEITLRVEVDPGNGVKFIFHPRQLESVLTQARQDLVDALKDGPDGVHPLDSSRWTVHEGTYGAVRDHGDEDIPF